LIRLASICRDRPAGLKCAQKATRLGKKDQAVDEVDEVDYSLLSLGGNRFEKGIDSFIGLPP
jgi:hypothetical protein